MGHLEEEGPLDCEESPEEGRSVPGSSQSPETKKIQKTSMKIERP